VCVFSHPKNPRRGGWTDIWADPAHMSYGGIPPTPGNWGHKKIEIHIWSWSRSRRRMIRGIRIPRTPDDQIWSLSLQYKSSHSTVPSAWWLKTEGCHPYWYVFTNQKRIQKIQKIQKSLKKIFFFKFKIF
jgi:hypothetical protein